MHHFLRFTLQVLGLAPLSANELIFTQFFLVPVFTGVDWQLLVYVCLFVGYWQLFVIFVCLFVPCQQGSLPELYYIVVKVQGP